MLRVSKFRSLAPLIAVAVAGVACSSFKKPKSYHFVGFHHCYCDAKDPTVHYVGVKDIDAPQCYNLEVEEVTMGDGSKYIGMLQDCKRWGEGESWDTKGHYKGTWIDNDRCGYGVFRYKSGCIYEGLFAKDLPNGHGKMTLPNGKVFEGEFVNGVLKGSPRFLQIPGTQYDGDVLGSLPHGKGCYIFEDGSTLECEAFCQGVPFGQAKFTSVDVVREGEFANFLLNGLGMERFKTGAINEGMFVNGKLHGQGKVTFRDKSSVSGNFVNGQPCGEIRMIATDDTIIEGTVLNGQLQGVVREESTDGSVVYRDYINDIPQNPVRMINKQGMITEGNLVPKVLDSTGTLFTLEGKVRFTFPNKVVQEVEYVDGKANGHFKATFPCGGTQEGLYKCGKMYGEWKITYPDGRIEVRDYTPTLVDKARLLEMEQRLIYLPKLKEKVKSVLPTKKEDK